MQQFIINFSEGASNIANLFVSFLGLFTLKESAKYRLINISISLQMLACLSGKLNDRTDV